MTIPSSQTAVPATLWPPPRMAISEIVVAGETHGRDHVGGPDASGNQARAPVDGTVPHCTGDVIVGVVGTDQPASESVNLHDGWLLASVADFRGRRCGHRNLLSRWPHRTTADRSCEVKNLDFTTEGGVRNTGAS